MTEKEQNRLNFVFHVIKYVHEVSGPPIKDIILDAGEVWVSDGNTIPEGWSEE